MSVFERKKLLSLGSFEKYILFLDILVWMFNYCRWFETLMLFILHQLVCRQRAPIESRCLCVCFYRKFYAMLAF